MARDMKKTLSDYYAAWSSHNADNLASYFADDLLCEDVPVGMIQHNKEEFKASWKAFFEGCPDFALEVKELFATKDRAACEWVMAGTHMADWPGMPATGKKFSVRGASILELREGKLRRETMYWDAVSLMQQLGFMPQMPSA